MMNAKCSPNNLEIKDFEPPKKKRQNENLDRWEENEFKILDSRGAELKIIANNSNNDIDSLIYETKELLRKFSEKTADWVFESIYHRKATLLIAIYLHNGIYWDHRSDITATRVLATLYSDELRAHKEGIYHYHKGRWKKIKELPEVIMNGMEKVFNVCQLYFNLLSKSGCEKSWDAVFDNIKSFDQHSYIDSNFIAANTQHWATSVGRSLKDLLARFTNIFSFIKIEKPIISTHLQQKIVSFMSQNIFTIYGPGLITHTGFFEFL